MLPLEVELCEQLGISADEYWDFVANAQDVVNKRSEEYAHIPDVQNELTSTAILIINLVVGVALTAVSALLAPKPRQAAKQKKPLAALDIDGSEGRSRYTKSSNFDSVQSLAELGETIPLVFADRSEKYGGIRIESQLLYSQMITSGTTQTLMAVMLLGAGELGDTPDFDGYAIGDLMLRDFSAYKNQLFFTPGRPTNNRLRSGVSGDQYEESKMANVTENSDAFSLFYPPAAARGGDRSFFSGTRTPSSKTTFGLHSPIPNGYRYMMPYELVTYASGDGAEDDQRDDSKAKIEKVINYYPRLGGIIASNDRESTYRLSSARLDTDRSAYRPWGLSDILQSQDETRSTIDEIIQEGQEYMLGEARAICIKRPVEQWAPEIDKDYEYVFTRPRGLAGSLQNVPKVGAANEVSAPWSQGCVQKLAVASLSNSRPCDATEIGIRSEVWRQIQGSANFNAHPEWDVIDRYQESNSGINLGVVTKYTKRYSFFRVYARKLGAGVWIDITGSRVFAVKGVTPEFIFNTLFVKHEEGQHEFTIVPVPGSKFYKQIQNNGIDIHLLDGRALSKSKTASNGTENRTEEISGYQIFYTGEHQVLTLAKATNPEWIFSYKDQSAGDKDGGPIAALEKYSDGNAIPVSTTASVIKGEQYEQVQANKSMVKIDNVTLERTYWWDGQIKGTSGDGVDQIDVAGFGGRELRYRILPEGEKPVPPGNELIPAGWTKSNIEYDIVFSKSSAPVYTYGVVKIGAVYQYWWNSIKVAEINYDTADWVVGAGGDRRYERINGIKPGGTTNEINPDYTDRFNGGQRANDANGNSKFVTVDVGMVVNTSTGKNDFYRGGQLLGSSNTVRLPMGDNMSYKRETRKQDGVLGGKTQLTQTSRKVDFSEKTISRAMTKGVIWRSEKRWLQVWYDGEFIGECPGLGLSITVGGIEYYCDNRYSENGTIGNENCTVFNVITYKNVTPIPELWSISQYNDIVTYDTWDIAKQVKSDGQDGRYWIQKLELNLTAPVLAEKKQRRLVDGDNESATVRHEWYRSDTSAPDAHRWTLEKGGNGYTVGNTVQINGTPVKVKITEIQAPGSSGALNEPSYGSSDNTVDRFIAFIDPGTNYSPLNAIADYFINNTDGSSHANGPEHSVIFCNEIIGQYSPGNVDAEESPIPQYENLAMAGIKLRNSKEWTSFNSLSAYVQRGLRIEHFFPDRPSDAPSVRRPSPGKQDADGKVRGSSNLFPEIAYHLLTDDKYGAGKLIGTQSVDRAAMDRSAKFCAANGFYWDGIIASNQNLREFIFQNAGYMLLDFTIKGGKFALVPSVPYNPGSYVIQRGDKPEIKALFTDGVMRAMTISFLSPEERQPFIGVCLFRGEVKNGFPVTRTMTMRLRSGTDSDPVEEFDCSAFMTSENHARQFLRMALKTRELIDHGIKFETTPQAAMHLEPGEYFRVASKSTHTDRFQSGSIDFEGNITSSQEFSANMDTTVVYWRPGEVGVSNPTAMSIRGGKVTNASLFGTLFCKTSSIQETRCYKCESLSYASDGLVEVAGSVAPLTNTGALQILDWTENDPDFVEETF